MTSALLEDSQNSGGICPTCPTKDIYERPKYAHVISALLVNNCVFITHAYTHHMYARMNVCMYL